jgi:hypothetical protein
MSQVWVVAGNGQSLTAIAPGRVLAHDRILRCNNFFFEERYHLGRRVDLAFIGGDPRVAPFVFETLNRARGQYDIGAWSSPNARVARWGRRYLRQGYRPLRYRDGAVEAEVARLSAKHGGLRPSTGVEALLMAHGMGARQIVLAGVDLYAGPKRYAYAPGRHQRDLLGEDLGTRSYDLRLHHPELDRALIGWLARREDLALWRAANGTALDDLLDLAPMREGPAPEAGPKPQVLDWASWAGWYPIGALKVMRRVRRWQRRLTGGLP